MVCFVLWNESLTPAGIHPLYEKCYCGSTMEPALCLEVEVRFECVYMCMCVHVCAGTCLCVCECMCTCV